MMAHTRILARLRRPAAVAAAALALGWTLSASSGAAEARKLESRGASATRCRTISRSDAKLAAHRGIDVATVRALKTQVGLTGGEICSMPSAALARAIERARHPKPDHPDEAMRFRLSQMQDENGEIPPQAWANAAMHMARMRAHAADDPQPLAGGIARGSWTSIGPGNIGGRVRSVVVHPTTPTTMFAGSVGGGIWKSTDGGSSWSVVDDFMTNIAVASLVFDPSNPNTMYAGSGEGFYNADGIRGAGVFKSTDGGLTWTQLSSTATSSFYYVNRLAFSPTGSILLAATRTGIWRTTNGGTSWSQASASSDITDVDFNPSNGSLAVASGRSSKTFYSVDGGATWIAASGIGSGSSSERIEVAYAPSNPNTVYASVYRSGGEIWKSTDGGQSYARVHTGSSYLGSQGWYDNVIWVDPTNANTVVVGGIDLWRSTDGGATLQKISQWWSAPNSAHADHHAIVAHPGFNGTSNTTVFFGNDGGVYRAGNVYTVAETSGWLSLNSTFGVTQFYGAAGNASSGVIVGGTQDNGTLRYSGNAEGWTTMFGGDGGWCAADPNDPNYFYGEYVYLTIHRSTNAGLTSSYIYSGISDANSLANFIAPFILDPNDANAMLAGGRSLWRSANVKAATPSWTSIKSSVSSNISAIAVAIGNSNIIWVGHNNGNVYRTIDGLSPAPVWTQMDLGTPALPNRVVTRITVDRNNSNIVYATFGSFSADNIYRSADGGLTWADITGSGVTGLPEAPVRSLVIHPNNSSWIYAGTEVGVFVSENSGTTWLLPHDGPANVSVDELFWMGTTLVAATHGRGLWRTNTTTTCTYVPAFTSLSMVASGTSGTLGITAPNGCAWTGVSSGAWLALTGASGSGNGSISYTAEPNRNTNSRSATLTVGGQTVTFTQDGTAGTVFSDVASSYWALSYVVAIFQAGITNGCGGGLFCPEGVVTREQMASFLVRAIEGDRPSSYCAGGSPFSDVPASSVHCGNIKRLSELGLTTVAATFNPTGRVTRGQMAAFIIRALYGETFSYTLAPYYSDVPASHGFFKYVQKMKDTGLTQVTGTYNVNGDVTRAQMAAFLARAFLGIP